MTTNASTVLQDRAPWVHRRFVREKLRVGERYWRPLSETSSSSSDGTSETSSSSHRQIAFVIPDGVVWRKYLLLLQQLITELDNDDEPALQWILLESAVELMDWRNSSPSIETDDGVYITESAAMQERNRIRKLVQNSDVMPFCDLSHRETDDEDEWDVLRYSEMNIVDRSRHALLRAGRMLLLANCCNNESLLIVDENDTQDELMMCAEQDETGVQVVTVESFMQHLFQRGLVSDDYMVEKLLETKRRCEEDYRRRNSPTTTISNPLVEDGPITGPTPYLSETQVQEALGDRTLVRGRLEVTKENPREGYVTADGQRYFVNQERGHFNRALHHDFVVVQPLQELEWGRPVGRRRLIHHRPASDDSDDSTSTAMDVTDTPAVPSARVVAIHSPSRRTYVATMVNQPMAEETAVLVVPMNIRIPKIRIQTRGWQRFVNKRLLVEVDGWDLNSTYPQGHCVQVLGDVGDLETEISCLLLEHEIQLEPFSASALACLPPQGSTWTIPETEIQQRRDLRYSHRIFSVDPPGCQDIDDTMHARILSNGDVEVGVHIADVTYFVPKDSALDKQAQIRGTTFYLVDRRFDMLPSLLSSDLCSLHGGVDRLAVSVIWTLSSDLETVKSCWYGRTVIHNCQAMTYEQAHNILHNKPPDDATREPPPPLTAGAPVNPDNIAPLKEDLTILTRLARKFRKDREEIGGAVDLSSGDLGTELKFVLDENGNPTRVSPKKEMEIHHTIAEMMILANRYVASKIYKSFPDSSLLRIHQTANEDRFSELQNALKAGGIEFDGSSNMALAQSLYNARLKAKGGGLVNSLWQSLATRAMSEAQYICTGDQEASGLSHYGLGIDKYTHFTSPIRRYADVVVHEQLLAALEQERETREDTSVHDQAPSRAYLDAVPDSTVMSVLGGDGRSGHREAVEKGDDGDDGAEELEGDDFLDTLIEGASELALGSTANAESGGPVQMMGDDVEQKGHPPFYKKSEVSKICEGLNYQNRMSKLSSMECQKLFLSLYFRENVEITDAVVTGLRVNGLLVYVPRFDLKGPVFLGDIDGNVQIDPALLGLPANSGSPPSSGFVAAKTSRKFPSGTCTLEAGTDDDDERLVIRVPESPQERAFRVLDVITVQLSCDTSDATARIPPPRLHLVSVGCNGPTKSNISDQTKVTSNMIQIDQKGGSNKPVGKSESLKTSTKDRTTPESLYQFLSSLEIRPILPDVPLRSQQPRSKARMEDARVETMAGRVVFGGFSNPDTRVATQEAAAAAAAEAAGQRRAVAVASQVSNDYQTNQNIERDVTARMQRKAAEKRNARKAKSK